MSPELGLILAIGVLLFSAFVWVAKLARAKWKERADNAEEKQEAAELTVEQIEEFNASYQGALGRSVARLRERIRLRRKNNRVG